MSSHAETSHTHESTNHNESAVETLFEGITKILSSVRIAVGKVFKGVKGLLTELVDTIKGKPAVHAEHQPLETHDTPAETVHKEAKAEEHH
jgi:hypothetical protein